MLSIEHVSKSFHTSSGKVMALAGVQLRLAAGEFVAVRGPSGCGKSTLLLTAGGLLRPDSGAVIVHDQNIYALGDDARARFRAERIGFVFQQFHLVPYLNVLHNVLAAALGLPLRDGYQRAEKLLERFGLMARAHHFPAQLSTGERQRTALARALFHQPALLLADEPTGNLDTANANQVLDALGELAHEGSAVLLVTHEAQAAARAHRVIDFVHAGRLEAAA